MTIRTLQLADKDFTRLFQTVRRSALNPMDFGCRIKLADQSKPKNETATGWTKRPSLHSRAGGLILFRSKQVEGYFFAVIHLTALPNISRYSLVDMVELWWPSVVEKIRPLPWVLIHTHAWGSFAFPFSPWARTVVPS